MTIQNGKVSEFVNDLKENLQERMYHGETIFVGRPNEKDEYICFILMDWETNNYPTQLANACKKIWSNDPGFKCL
jgi:hypothetical protein